MTPRHLLSLLLAGSAAFSTLANVIQPDAALSRAFQDNASRIQPSTRASFDLVKTYTAKEMPALYLFSNGDSSILVSADDQAPALVGYFDTPSSATMTHSPSFNAWMKQYASQIEWLRSNPEGALKPDTRATSRNEISPLTKSKWNQNDPYNLKCPEFDGKRSVTGCTATAFAQMLYYYKSPAKGTGSHSYVLESEGTTQTLSFNYGNTTFDWANMTDTYSDKSTDVQKEAVATLMYACGVAVDMHYTPSESGAYTSYIPSAMYTYLGYDKGIREYQRDYYPADGWDDMVYNQLVKFGPVVYSGQSDEGGHAFVCDGYKDGFFHINWGWGGYDDGYFLLSTLDPGASQGIGGTSSGYAYGQGVVANVQKPVSGSDYYYGMGAGGGIRIDEKSINKVQKFTLYGFFFNMGTQNLNATIGAILVDSTGKEYYLSSYNFTDLKPGWGYSEYSVSLPVGLAAGSYKLYPAFKRNDTWEKIQCQNGCVSYYNVTIEGNNAIFSPETVGSVSITGMKQSEPAFIGKYISVTGTMTNPTDADFNGVICLSINKKGTDTEVIEGGRMTISLKAKESATLEYFTKFYHESDDNKLEPGEYTAYFFNSQNSQKVSEPFTITVENLPEKTTFEVTNLSIVGDSKDVNPDNISFKGTLKCTEGYFIDQLTTWFFKMTGGTSIGSATSDIILCPAGSSVDFTITGTFSAAALGTRYFTQIYYDGNWYGPQVIFTISSIADVAELSPDGSVASSELFNLNGTKVASNPSGSVDPTGLQPGMYVLRIVTSSGKISSSKVLIK